MRNSPDKTDAEDQARIKPLLLDAKALAAVLSIGRTKVYQMDSSGHLGPMALRFGKRRLWRYEEIAAWVRAGCPRREVWLKMAQEQGFGNQLGRRF